MNTDINYIIQMSLNGDKKYQEILLEKLNPLIYKNIYKYWKASDSLIEDLKQEGYIIILESFSSFDKSRNVHYLQYIKTKIEYFYKNYYKKTQKYNDKIYNENKVYETIESGIELLIAKEESAELSNIITELSEIEQKIIYLYYYHELSLKYISELLNIPYRTVVSKKHLAITKLKKLIAGR